MTQTFIPVSKEYTSIGLVMWILTMTVGARGHQIMPSGPVSATLPSAAIRRAASEMSLAAWMIACCLVFVFRREGDEIPGTRSDSPVVPDVRTRNSWHPRASRLYASVIFFRRSSTRHSLIPPM
ncbi:hypothetical protein PAXRUDRAFT_398119 [Paxillus rubicundulus Ve08.2h10]|uniref:Uncharacterized protein n=1 Tax=Paxillus rubicundulus Ve08.2h10 TaxID=930991 RepID=A0A0D0CP92_9AGAM|nr:hypothetical protein PAXRUDRAFT_398119 [Paxillus rubicundulus Ve08.2h10]